MENNKLAAVIPALVLGVHLATKVSPIGGYMLAGLGIYMLYKTLSSRNEAHDANQIDNEDDANQIDNEDDENQIHNEDDANGRRDRKLFEDCKTPIEEAEANFEKDDHLRSHKSHVASLITDYQRVRSPGVYDDNDEGTNFVEFFYKINIVIYSLASNKLNEYKADEEAFRRRKFSKEYTRIEKEIHSDWLECKHNTLEEEEKNILDALKITHREYCFKKDSFRKEFSEDFVRCLLYPNYYYLENDPNVTTSDEQDIFNNAANRIHNMKNTIPNNKPYFYERLRDEIYSENGVDLDHLIRKHIVNNSTDVSFQNFLRSAIGAYCMIDSMCQFI